jgi:hypothetical protein
MQVRCDEHNWRSRVERQIRQRRERRAPLRAASEAVADSSDGA